MFGMSSEEFWEDDPMLYWAYRTFYFKKLEFEQQEKQQYMKYEAWLNGKMTYIAQSTALNNAFSKQKREFPNYEQMFKSIKEEEKKTKNEINIQVQEEFNAWARM